MPIIGAGDKLGGAMAWWVWIINLAVYLALSEALHFASTATFGTAVLHRLEWLGMPLQVYAIVLSAILQTAIIRHGWRLAEQAVRWVTSTKG